MKTILLVTEQFDPTADHLIQIIRRRGCPVLRWNLDQYPQKSTLTYRISPHEFGGTIVTDGRVVPLDVIGGVWYRASRCRGFPASLKPDELEFATREAESTLESLPLVTDWHWMNEPRSHRDASWKPAQLAAARRLGFATPRTVITNDPAQVMAFREECSGRIIFKALSQTLGLEAGKAGFTGIVTDEVLSSLPLIQHTPGIFQELIVKHYEIRLTVVAGKMFAAKILSQQSERTKIDWRIAPHDVEYEPTELPVDICDKVRAFMVEAGLVYSCIDFIVTPEGRHVFLESNPRGQFLWIEHYTGLKITEAIADALMVSKPSPCDDARRTN
jgi:glutathione synthase/RimK-type ligase-like ATP-grasp enzyme